MVQHPDSISDALMHLFYYQQGTLFEEAPSSPERSHPARVGDRVGMAGTQGTHVSLAAAEPLSPLPVPPTSFDERPTNASSVTSPCSNNIRVLTQRRDELKRRLEAGALKAEKEALENQVLHMQKEFGNLQEEFKEMKERFGEQLGALDRQLEEQQTVTQAAQKRVICTEDLIRFFEEQRRLMAAHLKAQCQLKDERIRALNLQLTAYTIDWQRLGTHKQTEASLTHELQCLQDRHNELRAEHWRRRRRKEKLTELLTEVQEMEAREKDEVTEAQQAASGGQASASSPRSRVRELEASGAGLRSQLQLLEEWRRSREAEAQQAEAKWPHSCIWRDELDVRERQLEKITSQLDKTNNALHAAQAALASQRLRHEDMKRRHRDAEAELREDERIRVRLKREYTELKRAEADLRRATEMHFGTAGSSSWGGVVRGDSADSIARVAPSTAAAVSGAHADVALGATGTTASHQIAMTTGARQNQMPWQSQPNTQAVLRGQAWP